MLQLTSKQRDLHLTVPFRISRGVQNTSPNAFIELRDENFVGYGEAAPSEYYGETVETVLAALPLLSTQLDGDPFQLEDIMLRLDHALGLNPSAKAAINMALYDLIGKKLGIPLYQLLGLNADRTPVTSFTIGIDTPEIMAQKALQAKEYPILKIKVGTPNDVAIIKAIREVSSATIRVDANGAWTPREAVERINAIAPYNIEFVEQPLSGSDLTGLKFVRDHVSLPIIADESCVHLEDIPRLSECVDGVNFKLMKSNGITNIIKMIHTARAYHLKTMLGCMIESSLAITAAAHISPLVDYADLDGNLLINDDPFTGVKVSQGKLVLPSTPGLGVTSTPN
jgi:L-alanine-DL-glutamate epimerase-like enolase superfamily enzyme